jgi:hypothetical protein
MQLSTLWGQLPTANRPQSRPAIGTEKWIPTQEEQPHIGAADSAARGDKVILPAPVAAISNDSFKGQDEVSTTGSPLVQLVPRRF